MLLPGLPRWQGLPWWQRMLLLLLLLLLPSTSRSQIRTLWWLLMAVLVLVLVLVLLVLVLLVLLLLLLLLLPRTVCCSLLSSGVGGLLLGQGSLPRLGLLPLHGCCMLAPPVDGLGLPPPAGPETC